LKVNVLSKTETALLINEIKNWPQNVIPKIKNLKTFEVEKNKKFLIHDNFSAIQLDRTILPFVGNTSLINYFPYILVDMGAIKFICNGAKIMRPGIIYFEFFVKNDIVVVKDKEHLKPLAVGTALEDSEKSKLLSRGHIINNLHYVGDKFWELYKEIKMQ
jgi:PUA domain protein